MNARLKRGSEGPRRAQETSQFSTSLRPNQSDDYSVSAGSSVCSARGGWQTPKPAESTLAAPPRSPLDTGRDQSTSAPIIACNRPWLLALVSTPSHMRTQPRGKQGRTSTRSRGNTAICNHLRHDRVLSVCCMAVLRDFVFRVGNQGKV